MKQKLKSKKESKEVIIQQIKPKCAFCGKLYGEIPITDGETQKEILICEVCDHDLEKVESERVTAYRTIQKKAIRDLTPEQEDYLLEMELELMRERKWKIADD